MAIGSNIINVQGSLFDSGFEKLVGSNFNIPNLISVAIRLMLIIGIVAAFLYLLMGAVQWVTAGGDKDGIEKAKKKITGAIVGLLIGFSVYAIIGIIGYITGTDFLNTLVIPHL